MRILINAANLTGEGARLGPGVGLVPEIPRLMSDSKFQILLPDEAAYRTLVFPGNTTLAFLPHPTGLANEFRRLQDLFVRVPRMARRFAADVCLSLGDLGPMAGDFPEITLLQQALYVYGNEEMSGRSSWPFFKRTVLSKLFSRTARRASIFIVQTPVMASRLMMMFPASEDRIRIIPFPAPTSRTQEDVPYAGQESRWMGSEKPWRLLFLATPYPHKNHAVLPAVAELLRSRGLSSRVQVFVTLDDKIVDSRKTRRTLSKYSDVITNLGHLNAGEVEKALALSSALFIPSLAESFGAVYLEAMAQNRPILTSDRDFSRWMCGNLALYFDPLDPKSIVQAIEKLIDSPQDPGGLARRMQARLGEFPRNWSEVAARYADVISGISK